MKIVILGLGTAGFAAMLAIKKTNPNAEIVIIDNKDFDLLHNCGMPYVIAGKIEQMNELEHHLDLEGMGVTKIKANAVSIEEKKIKLDNNETVDFDKLIIATGSKAFIPPVEGSEYVYIMDNVENAKKFKEACKRIKSIVIVGAGAIGIETAIALAEKGIKVNVVEMMGRVLANMLDNDMASLIQNKLEEKGIKFYLSRRVEKIGKKYVVLEGGKSVKGDLVLMAAGVRPNIEFIKNILIDKAVVVNDKMETNVKDIYAAGDCVQVKNLISGKPSLAWLAGPAYKQGTVAGVNSAGGNAKYNGAIGTAVVKMGEVETASTGFNKEFAEKNDFEIIAGKMKGTDTAGWYPDAKELTVKILVDKKTRKIIGGQAVGSNAANKINVVAAAIKGEMIIDDFSDLELAYCPSVGDAYDILVGAADLCLRKMNR